MQTDAFNHAPAQIFMNTGAQQFGRPSMGSWVTYGLGSESQDLPGFVVLSTGQKGTSGGAGNWGSGFLPTVYQGVPFRSQGDPILYLSNPRRRRRDDAARLARRHPQPERDAARRGRRPGDRHPHHAYEMAYRMQTSAPELMDLSKESQETLDDVRRRARRSRRSPTTACWPGGWSSAASASSSSSTRPGTTTATSTAA